MHRMTKQRRRNGFFNKSLSVTGTSAAPLAPVRAGLHYIPYRDYSLSDKLPKLVDRRLGSLDAPPSPLAATVANVLLQNLVIAVAGKKKQPR